MDQVVERHIRPKSPAMQANELSLFIEQIRLLELARNYEAVGTGGCVTLIELDSGEIVSVEVGSVNRKDRDEYSRISKKNVIELSQHQTHRTSSHMRRGVSGAILTESHVFSFYGDFAKQRREAMMLFLAIRYGVLSQKAAFEIADMNKNSVLEEFIRRPVKKSSRRHQRR